MSTTADPISTPESHVIVPSDLLGSLTISPDELIEFPAGLFGFPEARSFILLPAQRPGLFWLQSADHPGLVFLLADPFPFFDGYSVELAPADRAELQATESSEIAILTIVTLPATRTESPTANLQGPLALHLSAQRGTQLAIGDSEWGTRCELNLERGG